MDKFLNKFVKIYKCKYNHLVTIGNDIYEMSSDAHAPNGVNIYMGDANACSYDLMTDADGKEMPLSEASDSMKMAIVDRIEFGFNFGEDD